MHKQEPELARAEVHPATALLREFFSVSSEFETHFASKLGVNATDLVAMSHLIATGSLGPTELARKLKLTTAAITTSIDRLTALGHVTRIPNPADKRGVLVVPTAESVAAAMNTLLPMVAGINGVLEEFTETEKDTITRYLEKVVTAYRNQLPVAELPPARDAVEAPAP